MEAGINESAYNGLVKTLVHEIGSGYMDMFDLKSERVEGKMKKDPSYVMKRSETVKLNELCLSAVHWFSYFLKMYVPSEKMPSGFELKRGLVVDKEGDAKRGAKRRVNRRVRNSSCIANAIFLANHSNPFRDSLRSSQPMPFLYTFTLWMRMKPWGTLLPTLRSPDS